MVVKREGEALAVADSRAAKQARQTLEAARGNGTSMISLILPPKSQISMAAKMLALMGKLKVEYSADT